MQGTSCALHSIAEFAIGLLLSIALAIARAAAFIASLFIAILPTLLYMLPLLALAYVTHNIFQVFT